MRRLLAFILCVLLASFLGLGTAGHAGEAAICAEDGAATSLDHAGGRSDPASADGEKGVPHQHGCHGHHLGVPTASDPLRHDNGWRATLVAWEQVHRPGLTGDAALRPPRA